jgi:hypothetical protein
MSPLISRAVQSVGRAMRQPITILITLAGILAAGPASVAVAQEGRAPLVLHIAVAGSGGAILDGLIPDITAASGLSTAPDVKTTTAADGLREFCQGFDAPSPDIVLTTRRLSAALVAECIKNGVEHMAEVQLGQSALAIDAS